MRRRPDQHVVRLLAGNQTDGLAVVKLRTVDEVDQLMAGQVLHGPGLAVGKRFQIKQPRLPKLVWEVTDVAPGVSWTWVQRSPGGTTSALHSLTPIADDRTLVRQALDQRGPIGALIAKLMIRTTHRYLEMEAQGLKGRSEQLRQSLGPHS